MITQVFWVYVTQFDLQCTVPTAIKRFFKVVQAETVLQIEKSTRFEVVANLITIIESLSKYERPGYHCGKIIRLTNNFKLFMLII